MVIHAHSKSVNRIAVTTVTLSVLLIAAGCSQNDIEADAFPDSSVAQLAAPDNVKDANTHQQKIENAQQLKATEPAEPVPHRPEAATQATPEQNEEVETVELPDDGLLAADFQTEDGTVEVDPAVAANEPGSETELIVAPETSAPEGEPTEPADVEAEPVVTLGERLTELGYWHIEGETPVNHLRQAVTAFQKVEGLQVDGVAGPDTLESLTQATKPVPRFPDRNGVEVDIDKQVLFVVKDGVVQTILNVSTGREDKTPRGDHKVEWEIPRLRRYEYSPDVWWSLYKPKYFREGGFAIHGADQVQMAEDDTPIYGGANLPNYPASAGCVRVTNSAMDMLWEQNVLAKDTPVTVY